jgi:hypothetical protein
LIKTGKMDFNKRDQDGMLAVKVGLMANILLAILKTIGGVVGHSPALLADGINSTSDVAYYLVVGLFMRLAGKPPDYEANEREVIRAEWGLTRNGTGIGHKGFSALFVPNLRLARGF